MRWSQKASWWTGCRWAAIRVHPCRLSRLGWFWGRRVRAVAGSGSGASKPSVGSKPGGKRPLARARAVVEYEVKPRLSRQALEELEALAEEVAHDPEGPWRAPSPVCDREPDP
jgi:hypothetical protein